MHAISELPVNLDEHHLLQLDCSALRVMHCNAVVMLVGVMEGAIASCMLSQSCQTAMVRITSCSCTALHCSASGTLQCIFDVGNRLCHCILHASSELQHIHGEHHLLCLQCPALHTLQCRYDAGNSAAALDLNAFVA